MISLENIKNAKYPNPYLRRDDFISLDGEWECSFSQEEKIPAFFDKKIIVPFPVECELSKVNDNEVHDSVWYKKVIILNKNDKRVIINFLGSDYETILFVNGHKIGNHLGCYTTFNFDITDYLVDGSNEIVVHVKDTFAKDQLRGKQRTRPENYECWYVQTTGICRSVYLDFVDDTYIKNIEVLQGISGNINLHVITNNGKYGLIGEIKLNNKLIKEFNIENEYTELKIENPLLWDVDTPILYDLDISTSTIVTSTSFGFRDIKTKDSRIYINNKEVYLRLILDQGYWLESYTTPPSLKALYDDIVAVKEMGFNGVRKHQKIEDLRFYYLCDVLGLYVWGEIPSAYEFNERMHSEIKRDIPLIQKDLFNCVSIITWVLFNESWGIAGIFDRKDINDFVHEVYELSLVNKGNRLVVTNDGWNQTADTDLLSLHEYEQNANAFLEKYSGFAGILEYPDINHFGPAFNVYGKYSNQPVIFSEFGGVSCSTEGWGYGDKATHDDYIVRIESLFKVLQSLNYLSGYCYTQLTDVQQETNGLLTADRKAKVSFETIRKIVLGGK